ncbi:MAG: alanine--tRNA ligase [Verrucomicrobia bacterium]|nr:alanine--tRNA ligase [Verrucomicrobiota bacterium]
MTSTQIRQSFLDFFREKQHTLVPSSSLLPDSPNLLFTNAGMNQFVPIFLGRKAPDVSRWANAIPSLDSRAADTQKCIRAGGKHNDLEDVGLDTYHHTFFEMLGNWSFGDYFKKEAIEWAWELVVGRWKFPPQRLYATIYQPDASKGDPATRDQEAWDLWAALFRSVQLDPEIHIVNGNKKDNFWMMGDTGPCGPCSELHVDLTPLGDTKGSLVNMGTSDCIEIWNLVFIQFNANPDGSFSPLPAQHVDTGMGFERVCSILQGTRNFSDFTTASISNYDTDVFRPIFDELESLSGQKYQSTLPKKNSEGQFVAGTAQEQTDIAFRVIADHIRTLSFAIADNIQPGNTDRSYVLRRILRRAIRYGRVLGFREPFFYKLAAVLSRTMGDVFPEIRARQSFVEQVLKREEEAFNRTLDRGIALFSEEITRLTAEGSTEISGAFAFQLYDTYGFPLDLTELMARERGFKVDHIGFEIFMEQQRARARAAQKKEIIELSQIETVEPTRFAGYESLQTDATVVEVVSLAHKTAVILDATTAYAELGGQVGDLGLLESGPDVWNITQTSKNGAVWLHFISDDSAPLAGQRVRISVDQNRRRAVERHHTATHLLHWALHQLVSKDASQKGSFVGPDKLTFDFSSAALTPAQIAAVEALVNERILENSPVYNFELPYSEVKNHPDIQQFFGDKYGDLVRVVQIGGTVSALDGYSMELCGGTHTRSTGQLGLFRIVSEGAVAAGIRRIEAVAGESAYQQVTAELARFQLLAQKLNTPLADIERKVESLLQTNKDLEKRIKAFQQKEAAQRASNLLSLSENLSGTPALVVSLPDISAEELQAVADSLKGNFPGVVFLAGVQDQSVFLVSSVPPALTQTVSAGKLVQLAASFVEGKGGGRPDAARGAGRNVQGVDAALDAVRRTIST